MSEAYGIVRTFEQALARHVGAKYGVAVDNCTNALFLCLRWLGVEGQTIGLPARTFLSVPMAVMHAGATPAFSDVAWTGMYRLEDTAIWDSAAQLEPKSYPGGLMCVSFQYRKPLPIGKGGMVLTDDKTAADAIRRLRYLGRDEAAPFDFQRIREAGWNMTMTPEQAARGLALLELARRPVVMGAKDYQDLRGCGLW